MTTREQFQAAISGASTTTVAAGLATAIHLANLRELFAELEDVLDHSDETSAQCFYALKQAYTAII